MIKTDVPEILRPWCSERQDFIDKPLLEAISECGLVFATNEYRQDVFFYCQSTLLRKVRLLGTIEGDFSVIKDPLLNLSRRLSGNLVIWKSVSGITYLCYDSCVCVADVEFKSIHVLGSLRIERHQNTSVTK